MTLDLDRITHPLRLAQGSHQPGSGKGCANNVLSYIQGDAVITDFPTCSARPLSKLVAVCNDNLAGYDSYLSPKNSLIVLDLAWQTVGTANVSDAVVYAWVVELLTNPEWGIVGFAVEEGVDIVERVASMYRQAVAGYIVSADAVKAVLAEADKIIDDARIAGFLSCSDIQAVGVARAAAKALGLAAEATEGTRIFYEYATDGTPGSAIKCLSLAVSNATSAVILFHHSFYAVLYFTRQAIACWRRLAELDTLDEIDTVAVDSALECMFSTDDNVRTSL